MRNYFDLLFHGNEAQLEKLRENEHKCAFEEVPLDEAFVCLQVELKELWDEMDISDGTLESIERIRREAADVANFAHMIIYSCDHMIRRGENENKD